MLLVDARGVPLSIIVTAANHHDVTQLAATLDAIVPRHVAMRAQVETRKRIGKSLVPTGKRRVVVARVVAIPAEHDVAEAETALDRRLELLLVNVFAAQDSVDIGHGDLDAMTRRFPYGGDDLGGRGRSRHERVSRQWFCYRRANEAARMKRWPF